ncbi:MAG: hypothetical protein ACE5F1_15175 [Planctomycetota bacterium]
MRFKTRFLLGASALGLCVILAASAPASQDASDEKGSGDHAAQGFTLLKQLVGEWVMVGEDGKPGEEITSRARLTAGGSTILETIFPGTEKEMVTAYHRDGEDLVLTHYCVLGNQPRMKAQPTKAKNRLRFVCSGWTNMKSHDDSHMHEGRLTFEDENHLSTEWLLYEKGVKAYSAKFKLVRKERAGK